MKSTSFDSYGYGAKKVDDTSMILTHFGNSAAICRTSKNKYVFLAVMPWHIYIKSFASFRDAWAYVWDEFDAEYQSHTKV